MGSEEIKKQIAELEAGLSKTKYNKATEFHFAIVHAQIAKLRQKMELRQKKESAKGIGFTIKKAGDATVVLVGFPSVGKSTLLNAITSAHSKVAAYDFTTLDVIPGTLVYNGARIQILDVPGILYGAAYGSGRGKEVLSAVRNCDMALIIVEALKPEHYATILKELYNVGIRINETPPKIKIVRKPKGGFDIDTLVKLTKLSENTIMAVLKEMGIANADVLIKEDISLERLIDAIEGNRVYLPSITIVNKMDLVDEETLAKIDKEINPDLMMAAEQRTNAERLKEIIFERLKLARIFLKQRGKPADMKEPLIIKQPTTIKDVCVKIHRDFVRRLRFARVWGKSSKFPGQSFRDLDKELSDGDIVELHLR
jgi:hypothetical protein